MEREVPGSSGKAKLFSPGVNEYWNPSACLLANAWWYVIRSGMEEET